MKITIPLKPLSVNAAYQGRRFKTKEHNRYCRDLELMLPHNQKILGWVQVMYRFYLKNWKMTDGDNCVKALQDCIVKAGIIEDDRKILRYVIEKHPAKEDRIEVEISEYELKEVSNAKTILE